MSTARAQANQSLYLAKIMLANWQRALAEEEIPDSTLTHTFLPGTKQHLLHAYGWFLLEVSGTEQLTGRPPRGCADLPAVAAGKAIPGEIREFGQLEAEGWLAALIEPEHLYAEVSRVPGNLAAGSPDLPGIEQVKQWIVQLEALFDRMSDSLDEY